MTLASAERVVVYIPEEQAIELGQYDIGDREILSAKACGILDDMTGRHVAKLDYKNDYVGWTGLSTDKVPEYNGFYISKYVITES